MREEHQEQKKGRYGDNKLSSSDLRHVDVCRTSVNAPGRVEEAGGGWRGKRSRQSGSEKRRQYGAMTGGGELMKMGRNGLGISENKLC